LVKKPLPNNIGAFIPIKKQLSYQGSCFYRSNKVSKKWKIAICFS